MMEFMGNITDDAGWERNAFDETIVEKWREEVDSLPPLAEAGNDVYLSSFMFDQVT